ncbi:hypothetical protein C8F01DRAFT_1362128 [Mycena amicta]|nr:hypothetical protein C8F01DRAFT_1362128 [Mycena amicta]
MVRGTMPRLSLLDYLHRSVVYTLLGISAYSIFVGVNGHSARRAAMLERSKGTYGFYSDWVLLAKNSCSAERKAIQEQQQQEELALARAAQEAVPSQKS